MQDRGQLIHSGKTAHYDSVVLPVNEDRRSRRSYVSKLCDIKSELCGDGEIHFGTPAELSVLCNSMHNEYFVAKVKEKKMANKKFWVGMPVMVLAFGMTVVGCASAPGSFVRGPASPVTIMLRPGLDFDQAFREVSFILLNNNFQTETLQPEAGFIRTNWRFWVSPRGQTVDSYRVRVSVTFNPARTQVILNVEGQMLERGSWVPGWDRAVTEDLRTELLMAVGN